jgi:hypothetical protein
LMIPSVYLLEQGYYLLVDLFPTRSVEQI